MNNQIENIDETALDVAERLRTQHNGIFGVRLFLGHDGNNQCILEDYDGVIGEAQSGIDLRDAIYKALHNKNYRFLTSTESGKSAVLTALSLAGEFFGEKGDGVFNTGCFQRAINQVSNSYINTLDCVEILLNHSQVVRLSGGAHWLLLPNGFVRF